jgi:hypothetical protein
MKAVIGTDALPLLNRSSQILSVDNAQDAWSDLVAGIAPLLMLVGDRVTKQHLRESTTRVEYYMLGATPLGLITSMVSLLRLASIPLAARLIGRSDELVREACKEVTPVNTDVPSVLSAGVVQRGDTPGLIVSRLHVRELILTIPDLRSEVGEITKGIESMNKAYTGGEGTAPEHTALIVGRLLEPADSATIIRQVDGLYKSTGVEGKADVDTTMECCLSAKVTAVGSEVNFLHGQVRSMTANRLIVLASVAAIVAVQIASLADGNWDFHLPWLLVVVGYTGLLVTIFLYAEAIKGRIRTSTVVFSAGRGTNYCALQYAELDKDGGPGYVLPVTRSGGEDVVKISCLLRTNLRTEMLGTLAGIMFSISFLIHYLGLRSVQWWVSVCELSICFIMVIIRTVASRTPLKFTEAESAYDTDLRSVGVIRPSARIQAHIRDAESTHHSVHVVRAHFGIRNMGPQTQGDLAAALLANHLKQWHPEKLQKVFDAIGLIQCQANCLTADKHVVMHAGGTGILTKEGYLRPAKLQVWAQELTVDQVRSQSLIGWSINGLMRNEDLEIIPAFRNCVTQQVFVPASDSVVDWWLRSESSNSWIANCGHLQWGGVIGLALLFCALDVSESPEIEKALSYRLQDADRNPGLVARAVADELHKALSKLLADGELELA